MVFIDLNMPFMNGDEVMRRVQAKIRQNEGQMA
eukprot:CAMPEP_0202974754 /NCGR_PEP_ID=MMETSP1396-20130829/63682_1 /ASSEMBLY_ACC=CAM_ASM_000872 /TAXON_ID= /ORGANISM="Pseudokeronopsis sp., Strain Brazil" /LENGTH=32 /DNA_ID= /DNA_START= /DNA_END= /DNA_ORIENTATION=